MKLATGVRLLRVLNSRAENALTTKNIARRWRDLGCDAVSIRSIERYMIEMSEDGPDGPALVAVVKVGRERAYYLKPSQVANWFMTEEAALDLQLTHQVLGRTFGARGRSNGDKFADMAERIASASPQTKRIRERLRIAPDGIGRLPARIDPQVLQAAIDAIGKNRKLKFDYVNVTGKASAQLVSPLGLVAKDGTVYLVGIKGLSDSPRHFALHRVSQADVHFQQAQPRPEFDLDDYIRDSHQFSHVLDPQVPAAALKLRVAPEAMFHFTERSLSADQKLSKAPDGWYVVTATVPDTVLLVPFLVSMGPWIEVTAPASIRARTAQWLRESSAHYVGNG